MAAEPELSTSTFLLTNINGGSLVCRIDSFAQLTYELHLTIVCVVRSLVAGQERPEWCHLAAVGHLAAA